MKTKITKFQDWKQNSMRFMLCIAFSGIASITSATNYYFVTSGGGAWEDLNNWKTESVTGAIATILPQTTDEVFLDGPSIIGGTVTITSSTTATISKLSMGNCKLVNSGTLNVQGYAGTSASSIITLGSSILQNDGALNVKNSASAANALITLKSDAALTAISSQFINNGTLALDNTAWTSPTNVFTFSQNVVGTQPKVTLNGTADKYSLTLKPGVKATVNINGTYLFYNATTNCNAIVDGNATITTPIGTQLCAVLLSPTASLTFSSTSNMTFNAEQLIYPVQYITTNSGANVINNGNITINSLTQMSQAIYLANGNFTNNAGATLTVKGAIVSAVSFGTVTLSSFTNNGTIDFDNSSYGTAGAVVLSSAGGGNENFTNTGTINIKAAIGQAAFAFGNSTTYPAVSFTNSGTIKTTSYITSGGAVAATPYKYNNSGTFDFDVASNTSDAIKVANFINTGTVKGRGIITGLTTSTGTLSPGNTTNAIGIFDIQGATIALTGNIALDINGIAEFDQITNSTAGSVLNVTGATLNVTKGGSYSPVEGDILPLIVATNTLAGPFSAVILPSTAWSMNYASDVLKAQVKYSTATNAINDLETNVKVFAGNNELIIKGINGQIVAVHSITGKLIKKIILHGEQVSIPVTKGFYMVSVGYKNCKVLVP